MASKAAARSAFDLINEIKKYWPDSPISKELLLQPTTTFVVKFYNDFIQEFNDKLAYLIKDDAYWYEPEELYNKEPEVRTFYRVSKIFKNINTKFMLGDICQPTPIRTKNFFLMCIHYLIYIDRLIESKNCDDIFEVTASIQSLEVQKEELIEKSNELAETLVQKKDLKQQLLTEKAELTRQLQQKQKINEEKKREIMQKKKEINTLNQECSNAQYDLEKLSDIEQKMQEQVVAPVDYQNMQQVLENLHKEYDQLESCDVDFDDVLKDEKKILQHCENCLEVLKTWEIKSDYVNSLTENENLLKETAQEYKLVEKQLENVHIAEKEIKVENKHLCEEFEETYDLREQTKKKFDTNLQILGDEFIQLTNEFKLKIDEKTKCSEQLQSENLKLEEEKIRIKNIFAQEYERVLDAERKSVNSFKSAVKVLLGEN